jgi:hypothetical protein
MPLRDGTGPLGKGAKTGQGLGQCGDEKPRGCGRSFLRGLRRNRIDADEKKSVDREK